MSQAFYTPFVKSKRGEASALQHLDPGVKQMILPFFDVLALEQGVIGSGDVEAHVVKQSGMIAKAWAEQGPCYVDLFDVNPAARCLNGVHPLLRVMGELLTKKVKPIPVLGLERDVGYRLAAKQLMEWNPPAVAVRLELEDMQLVGGLAQRVYQMLLEVGAAALPLHIICDFRSIWRKAKGDDGSQVFKAALKELRALKPLRIVFAASNMVDSMAAFKPNSINLLPRRDLDAWKQIVNGGASDIAFGDYGVVHPDYVDLDPRFIKPSAKIRYATPSHWVVVKGTSWRDNTSQHHILSQQLRATGHFRDSGCWGDEYIASAAIGRPKYGTLETWVTIDQNSHITLTANQVIVEVAQALHI